MAAQDGEPAPLPPTTDAPLPPADAAPLPERSSRRGLIVPGTVAILAGGIAGYQLATQHTESGNGLGRALAVGMFIGFLGLTVVGPVARSAGPACPGSRP
jgi:hypothetical protein